MKIVSIHLYSHDGRRRDLPFKIVGLNIITGRSSTGKSALSEIIEYCKRDVESVRQVYKRLTFTK